MPQPPLAPVIKLFSEATRDRLRKRGWKKRSGDLYTLGDGEFIGWLGLNRATKYELRINPVVGVRCQPLERQVAILTGQEPHAYVPPTLSSPVGYLRPEGKFLEIAVASVDDVERAAADLVQLVAAYGEPFIRLHSTFDSVRDALEAGVHVISNDQADYRLPTLYGLAGTERAALVAVETGLARRDARADGEADAYRSFAAALQEWLRNR